jgi:hypothetical protein
MTPHAVELVDGAFYQHDPEGHRVFQHRYGDKWDLLGRNRSIPGFLHEPECRGFLRELAQRWDGRLAWLSAAQSQAAGRPGGSAGLALKLEVVMASCAARETLRADVSGSLAGWRAGPLTTDEAGSPTGSRPDPHGAGRSALDTDADYVLFLERSGFQPSPVREPASLGTTRRELHRRPSNSAWSLA